MTHILTISGIAALTGLQVWAGIHFHLKLAKLKTLLAEAKAKAEADLKKAASDIRADAVKADEGVKADLLVIVKKAKEGAAKAVADSEALLRNAHANLESGLKAAKSEAAIADSAIIGNLKAAEERLTKDLKDVETTEYLMLCNAKQRARLEQVPFDLTYEDIVIPDKCPMLGIPLVRGKKQHDGSPSLDRRRPELGYVRGNVEVISARANRIKNDATLDELLAIASHMQSCTTAWV